ncbi:MAG: hypothetical protein ABIQ53_05970 [Terracoccus sp.]
MTAAGLTSVLALLLLGLASAFQAALALGVPWGAMAYGGRVARTDGTLPARYRITSMLTVVFLGVAAWSVHAKVEPALWAFAAIFAVNTMANLGGRHPVERWGMSALTLGLAALCASLALT